MGSNNEINSSAFKSHFSFLPLIRTWKKIIESGRGGNHQFYKQLLDELGAIPELMQPVTAEEILKKHAPIIERVLATLFPVTMSDDRDLFAVLQPFNHRVLYASSAFRQMVLYGDEEYVNAKDLATAENLNREKLCGAYQLILNQHYQLNIAGEMTSIHQFVCPETALDKYMEMTLDTSFIDVLPEADLPELTLNTLNGLDFHDILKNQTLLKQLPVNSFRFEGFVLLRIAEVTEREIINKIKNNLLNIHSFADEKIFGELDYQMQNLAGVHELHTAIKPFFMVNNHLVLSEIITTNKTAKKYPLTHEQQYELYKNIETFFKSSPGIIVVSDINQLTIERYPFLHILYEHNFKSVIVAPLFKEKEELLGILIIAHRTVTLGMEHLARIRSAIPLFAIALQRSQEQLDHEVDRVIKEQFTAVQEAVEWRFTKAALNYLTKKDKLERKMEPIVFGQVYPLYGAIDITEFFN